MAAPSPSTQTLQLEAIHLPPQPGFWPPAPGWWLTAALLLVLSGLATRQWWRWRRQRRERARIEATLQRLARELREDPQHAVIDINVFLRKMALTHFPDADVASLTGDDWLAFLDRSGETTDFTHGPGRVLAEGPYRARLPAPFDGDALLEAVRRWTQRVTATEARR